MNNAWGGYEGFDGEKRSDGSKFGQAFWEQDVNNRWTSMFERGVRFHLFSSKYAAPLLIKASKSDQHSLIINTTAWAFDKCTCIGLKRLQLSSFSRDVVPQTLAISTMTSPKLLSTDWLSLNRQIWQHSKFLLFHSRQAGLELSAFSLPMSLISLQRKALNTSDGPLHALLIITILRWNGAAEQCLQLKLPRSFRLPTLTADSCQPLSFKLKLV